MSLPDIAIENLSLRLGAFALRDIGLRAASGEILVILGPNGAGKSVTLETIAGFHRLQSGRIMIGGRDVTALPPEHRHVGLVFQNFGLFPHLSVARNVAIGVTARRSAANGGAQVGVPALLAHFGIAHLAQRKPGDLSAGEQQRVGLARAFANRPNVFLFDEPFSAIDAQTRDQLRQDFDHFVRDAGIPAILVTHDHTDARVLGDRIAVIHRGEVVQHGPSAEVFRRPANRFVANFMGLDNVLAGRVAARSGDRVRIAVGDGVLYAEGSHDRREDESVAVCIRAEDVMLHPLDRRRADAAADVNLLPARIVAMKDLGALTKITVDCGCPLTACLMSRDVPGSGFVPQAAVIAEIKMAAIHLADNS